MRVKQKTAVAITLIVVTALVGVYQNERTTGTENAIQTGAYTSYDIRKWPVGSRNPTITDEASQRPAGPGLHEDRTGLLEERRDIQAQQGNGILLHGSSLPEESADVESNSLLTLGAGYLSNVKVRPGYRYYDADDLAKGLLHDLVPLAPFFIEAQETYGIDAVFLAAIAAEESGWGRHQFRKNNIFGFEKCDFDSLEHCIDYAASWLNTQYLTPGGRYYEGVGVADVNKHYNGRKTWEEHVGVIMGQIVNRIESEGN